MRKAPFAETENGERRERKNRRNRDFQANAAFRTNPGTRARTGVSGRRKKGQSNVWPWILGGKDREQTRALRISRVLMKLGGRCRPVSCLTLISGADVASGSSGADQGHTPSGRNQTEPDIQTKNTQAALRPSAVLSFLPYSVRGSQTGPDPLGVFAAGYPCGWSSA